jgi:hypothetical protein
MCPDVSYITNPDLFSSIDMDVLNEVRMLVKLVIRVGCPHVILFLFNEHTLIFKYRIEFVTATLNIHSVKVWLDKKVDFFCADACH